MAERNFDTLGVLGRKKSVVAGSVAPAAGPTTSDQQGTGFAITHSGVAGVYSVAFTDRYARCLYAHASLVQANRSQYAEVSAVDPAAGTATIHVMATGGAVLGDITIAAGTRLEVLFVMDDQLNL